MVTDDVLGRLVSVATAPWTIAIAAVLAAFAIGRLIVRLARPLLARLAGHTSADWDDRWEQVPAGARP